LRVFEEFGARTLAIRNPCRWARSFRVRKAKHRGHPAGDSVQFLAKYRVGDHTLATKILGLHFAAKSCTMSRMQMMLQFVEVRTRIVTTHTLDCTNDTRHHYDAG
jgi:hypothetical protein